jgi:uroporphyrinogen-III synthase
MREFNVPVTLTVPEPNTWREIIKILDENPATVQLKERRIAIQEHGEPSPELYAALRERGAEIVPVRVYRWELPEDIAPLQNAIRALTENKVDVVMFTSSVQYVHAARVAADMGLGQAFNRALNRAVVASIGPIASETLRENGVEVDLEPSHPKMGFLVKETADKSSALLSDKVQADATGSSKF